MKREEGFTLIEMMAVMVIAGIILTLGATALRTYWLTQSWTGAADEVVSQLRQQQARVTSESNPLVYGIRFPVAGSSTLGLVRYNPGPPVTCEQYATATTNSGFGVGGAQVVFPDTSYPAPPSGYGFQGSAETNFCAASITLAGGGAVTSPPLSTSDEYAWFYARGTATPGRLTIRHTALPGKSISVTVEQLTGRVEKAP